MMVLMKVYQCSVSSKFEYRLLDSMESYTVISFHNNRVAVKDSIGQILWIQDRNYNLNTGDCIRFDLYGISKYDVDGYVISRVDYNYDLRIKDIKNNATKYWAVKSLLSSCDDIKKIIKEAEIEDMVNKKEC